MLMKWALLSERHIAVSNCNAGQADVCSAEAGESGGRTKSLPAEIFVGVPGMAPGYGLAIIDLSAELKAIRVPMEASSLRSSCCRQDRDQTVPLGYLLQVV